jgi:hypothetical protein
MLGKMKPKSYLKNNAQKSLIYKKSYKISKVHKDMLKIFLSHKSPRQACQLQLTSNVMAFILSFIKIGLLWATISVIIINLQSV